MNLALCFVRTKIGISQLYLIKRDILLPLQLPPKDPTDSP